MKKTRFAACILAAALAVGSVAGCGSASSSTASSGSGSSGSEAQDSGSQAEAVERKVIIGETLDPETLLPYSALYADRYALLCTLYQPLMLVAGNEQYNVLMSELEEVSPRSFRVHLYEDIYDTAGNHFTADDVLFSYEMAEESGNYSKLGAVSNIEKVDDYTVQIDFDDSMIYGQINSVLS